MNFQYLYSLLQDKQAALLIASFPDPQYGTHNWRLTEGLGTGLGMRLDGSETEDLLSILTYALAQKQIVIEPDQAFLSAPSLVPRPAWG